MTFPKRITIAFAPLLPGSSTRRADPLELSFLLRANGRVFLTVETWRAFHSFELGRSMLATLAITQAATEAVGGRPAKMVGMYFEALRQESVLRVEVMGGIGNKARGLAEILTATMFVNDIEGDATSAQVPFSGPRFAADVAVAGELLAAQLVAEWMSFAAGAGLSEGTGAT